MCKNIHFLTLILLLQVAKFPFEEIPARKQGAKQEPCSSAATPGLVSSSGSAGVSENQSLMICIGEKLYPRVLSFLPV